MFLYFPPPPWWMRSHVRLARPGARTSRELATDHRAKSSDFRANSYHSVWERRHPESPRGCSTTFSPPQPRTRPSPASVSRSHPYLAPLRLAAFVKYESRAATAAVASPPREFPWTCQTALGPVFSCSLKGATPLLETRRGRLALSLRATPSLISLLVDRRFSPL